MAWRQRVCNACLSESCRSQKQPLFTSLNALMMYKWRHIFSHQYRTFIYTSFTIMLLMPCFWYLVTVWQKLFSPCAFVIKLQNLHIAMMYRFEWKSNAWRFWLADKTLLSVHAAGLPSFSLHTLNTHHTMNYSALHLQK